MLLEGQRVLPARLLDTGFVFAHPTVDDALAATVGR
jgi:NAD dependent epimerase/dehydratase family enzyme